MATMRNERQDQYCDVENARLSGSLQTATALLIVYFIVGALGMSFNPGGIIGIGLVSLGQWAWRRKWRRW